MLKKQEKVGEIIEAYGYRQSNLIVIMQGIQAEFNFLSEEALVLITEKLNDNKSTLETLDLLEDLAETITSRTVRPGSEHLQARPEHTEVFPQRVSGSRRGPSLPHLQWREAPSHH